MLRFRLYYDKDAELEWLNRMSRNGYAVVHYFLGFYTFERTAPGEYLYEIDILDNWSGDRRDFATFMEENDVEVVGQWWRWVYLRKKAVDGPFELYTDINSKIEQYTRILNFFRPFLIFEIVFLAIEVICSIVTQSIFFSCFSVLLLIICFAFSRIVWKCKWKIDELKRQ